MVAIYKQKGFTLTEAIVIIVLLGVLAAYATTRLPSSGQMTIGVQAQQVANAIRYTQSLAFARDQRYRINFTSTGYSITTRTGTPVPDPFSGNNTVTLDHGTTMTTTNSLLVFNGLGVPYRNTALPGALLAANATITLTSSEGSIRRVRVVPQTGLVQLL